MDDVLDSDDVLDDVLDEVSDDHWLLEDEWIIAGLLINGFNRSLMHDEFMIHGWSMDDYT